MAELRDNGLPVEVLFLQADEDVLLKRYSETRRRHPLDGGDLPLREAIRQERRLLELVVAGADLIIDTSETNLYQLRDLIGARVLDSPVKRCRCCLNLGFKNGVPADADFVFDVR